jgi:hypothetical protein
MEQSRATALGTYGAPGCPFYTEVRFGLVENHLKSVLKEVVRALSPFVNVEIPTHRFIALRNEP